METRKTVTDELICKAERETDAENKRMETKGKRRVGLTGSL